MDNKSGGARMLQRLMAGSLGLCGMEAQWIDEAVAASGHHGRRCYWMPVGTIMAFLRQILLGHCSCRSAVAGTLSAGLASDLSAGAAGDVASRANDKCLYKPEGRRAYRLRDFRAAVSLFMLPITWKSRMSPCSPALVAGSRVEKPYARIH